MIVKWVCEDCDMIIFQVRGDYHFVNETWNLNSNIGAREEYATVTIIYTDLWNIFV